MHADTQDDLRLIEDFAVRVRRRILLTSVLSAVLASLVAILAFAALGVVAVLFWGPLVGIRVTTVVLVGLSVVALAGALTAALFRSRADDLRTARFIEANAPQLRDSLVTLVSYQDSRRTEGKLGFSPALFSVLVARVTDHLLGIDARKLVPTGRLRRLAWTLGLVWAGVLVSALFQGDVLAVGLSQLLNGAPPVIRASVDDIRTEPSVVSDLRVFYVPPAYTDLPEREENNVSGDIRALPGTHVRLETRSLVSALEAYIVFESRSDEPLSMQARGSDAFAGSFVIREPERYRFRVRTPAGRLVEESAFRLIEVAPDATPELRLLIPESDRSVKRDERVEILFEAGDDFGLREITIAYEREGRDTAPVRRRFPLETLGSDRRGHSEIALEPLELRPGERIELWVEATDNDEVSGPKTGRSPRRVLRVFSPDEKHQAMLRREREMFERLLDLLARRLVMPRAQEIPVLDADAFLEESTEIVNVTREALRDFEQLLADMGEDPLTREDVLRDCAEIHSRLSVLLDGEIEVVKNVLRLDPNERGRKDVQRTLTLVNKNTVVDTERAVLQLDRIVDRQHQDRVLDEGRELVRHTQDLLKLLKKLEDDSDDAALRLKMLREIDRMQASLDKMAGDIRRQAKALPHERYNPAALGDRGTMNAMRSFRGELEGLRRLVQEGRLDEARERLEALARGSRDMMAELEGDYDEQGSARRARSARLVRRFRRRIERVVKAQEKIQQSTAEHGQSYREAVQDRLAGRVERAKERLGARLDRLDRLLRNINRADMHPQDREVLDKVLSHAGDIRRLLGEGDMGHAASLADLVDQRLRALGDEVGQAAMFAGERDRKRALRKAERRLGHAEEAARELSEGLRSLLPDPEEIMERREQRRVKRLAGEQDSLRKRLERVRRGMESLGEEQPGLHGQLGRLLDEAERSMERAGGELEQLNPGMAEEHQRSVLQKLAAATEQLDRAARPEKSGPEGVGVGDRREAVKIPQADQYQVPAAFREEILKAMREEMPPAYRELLEAYYESLIR